MSGAVNIAANGAARGLDLLDEFGFEAAAIVLGPEGERERFASQFRPMAERQVRRDLVIDTLAERESLAATESELDDRVTELATRRGTDPGQLYASLQKAGRLKELERGITEEKVFKWLYERNTIE